MSDKDLELDIETGEEVVTEKEPVEKDLETPEGQEGEGEGEGEGHDDEDSDKQDEGDDHADEGGESESGTDEEREAIRARRREERKNRKLAAKEREETLRRELAARDSVINELRAKVDNIERRSSGSELAQLDQAKKQTAQAYAYFKEQIKVATEAGNGAAVADATEKLIQAQRKFEELTQYEQAFKQRQATPQPLDPRLVNHAKEWMGKNAWYDPSAKDQDSRVVMTLDNQLAQEGWDPTTPQYWQELSARIKKYLPHRVKPATIPSTPRSVVAGRGREGGNKPSAGKTYKLSAERVAALKEAGLWDDPKQRSEAIKRFRDYDKQEQKNG